MCAGLWGFKLRAVIVIVIFLHPGVSVERVILHGMVWCVGVWELIGKLVIVMIVYCLQPSPRIGVYPALGQTPALG